MAKPSRHLAVLDANVPTPIRSAGVPVVYGSAGSARSSTPGSPLMPTGSPVIGDPTFRATSRVMSLTPELSKGLEFDLVVLIDPQAFGTGIEGTVDRYVAMTRATQQLIILTTP